MGTKNGLRTVPLLALSYPPFAPPSLDQPWSVTSPQHLRSSVDWLHGETQLDSMYVQCVSLTLCLLSPLLYTCHPIVSFLTTYVGMSQLYLHTLGIFHVYTLCDIRPQ